MQAHFGPVLVLHTKSSSSLVCRSLVFEGTTIELGMQATLAGPAAKERRREKAFGRALQEARKKKKLSQEDLGFASGYHRTYVSFLERGLKSPSLSTIMDLADTLEIRASDLIVRIEEILRREPPQ